MNKLIPKFLTPWGPIMQSDNTRVAPIITLPVIPNFTRLNKSKLGKAVLHKVKKENPDFYNKKVRLEAHKAKPNSEIVRYEDAKGKTRTSSKVIGMSGADPVGEFIVTNIAAAPIFKGLGKVAEYGLAKAGNKWARAKILSRNLDNSPKNIDKATQAFRNSEWSNFLSTRNGDNYYRMAKSSKLPNTNIEGEKLFISHTTPWEEFSGLGTSEPIGTKVLYEFPTKTFGVRKATNYRGIPGEIDVTQMGRNHLNFGNTSSGFRSKVLLLPKLQAETIGMEPYTIGINSRPLNKRGFYDTRPDYEDIYLGNQTAVTSLELRDALLNSKYNLFEYSPSGITKKLYLPNN